MKEGFRTSMAQADAYARIGQHYSSAEYERMLRQWKQQVKNAANQSVPAQKQAMNENDDQYLGGGPLTASNMSNSEALDQYYDLAGETRYDVQFINLPEGSHFFLDLNLPPRDGADHGYLLMTNPPRNIRAGLYKHNTNFYSTAVLFLNRTSRHDWNRESFRAFQLILNGNASDIPTNKIYFRYPNLHAHPSGKPGGWRYGVIDNPIY